MFSFLKALGDRSIGKTTLLFRIRTGRLPGDYIPAVLDNYELDHPSGIRLMMWDTGIADEYSPLRTVICAKEGIYMICYNCVQRASYERVFTRWLPMLLETRPTSPWILVGLKSDLKVAQKDAKDDDAPISNEEAAERVKEHEPALVIQVSSLVGEKIDELVNAAAEALQKAENSGKTKNANRGSTMQSCSLM